MLEARTGPDHWERVAQGETDNDGRIRGFVLFDRVLPPGTYRMRFETATISNEPMYKVSIHGWRSYSIYGIVLHITFLLLSPYGYSTYRGS